MASKFKLSTQQIQQNIEKLKSFMQHEKLDAFYISSFDEFLNEYVPMSNCHRYYFTGFSGSVAEVLIPIAGRPKVYVDGRYHEQADLECDSNLVEVVKVASNKSLLAELKEDFQNGDYAKVGLEADRTATSFYEYLQKDHKLTIYAHKELEKIVAFEPMPKLPKITHLTKEQIGSTTSEKLSNIFTEQNHAYYITAIDSLAWLSNCRGYHLPNLSSFLGRGLALRDKLYVFVGTDVEYECSDPAVEFVACDLAGMEHKLAAIQTHRNIEKLYIDKGMLNAADFLMLNRVFPAETFVDKKGGLVEFHSIKDAGEIKVMKDSFARADKAIYNTIKWAKDSLAAKKDISELDLHSQTWLSYQEQGAVELSFGTIAGVGANGSIIHYGDPKADVKITADSMCLLDSGGYFETGFATDTTRTFMAADQEGSAKHKEIYTLVLKAVLNAQNAVFKSGTKGTGLDAITRQPLYQKGYDYAHGTGHGVGIHVHEGGVGIGPTRGYELKPGQVVSLEPGIYIPGFGGVRLENIALVKEHPEFEGFLCFESLVYIGFEPLLIEESLLNEQEKIWLNEYEKECEKRGTSFR